MPTTIDSFGSALRWWRTTRRYSQLQLAVEAEVSSRHISFLETGKAQPSREMVVHLATVLDVPLRDRNLLLHAAGFAPAYGEADLDAPEMDDVRRVIDWILDAYCPNPAAVVDRRGDIVAANPAAARLVSEIVAADSPALSPAPNVHRLALHPDGLRPVTSNWHDVAANVLQRLEREQAHRPADESLAALLEEVLTYPGVAELRRRAELPTGADLLLPMESTIRSGEAIRLVSTIGTIGAPYDVTLDELRLETFFPADEATRAILARWQSEVAA
jgi:transcriptional regulator with XRE-family HTH domain